MTIDPLWYELRNCVHQRQFAIAEKLLAAKPELFELRNGIGETVLHFLAVENDREGVEWLYYRGFSVNTQTRFGEPMVFEVAALGHKELLLWLADHGADFFVVDRKNRNIIEFLRRRRAKAELMVQFVFENIPLLKKLALRER
jgi:hypothetical protein